MVSQEITDEELCDMVGMPCQAYLSAINLWVDVLLVEVDLTFTVFEYIEVTPTPTFENQVQIFEDSGYRVYEPPRGYMEARLTRAQWKRYLRRVPEKTPE